MARAALDDGGMRHATPIALESIQVRRAGSSDPATGQVSSPANAAATRIFSRWIRRPRATAPGSWTTRAGSLIEARMSSGASVGKSRIEPALGRRASPATTTPASCGRRQDAYPPTRAGSRFGFGAAQPDSPCAKRPPPGESPARDARRPVVLQQRPTLGRRCRHAGGARRCVPGPNHETHAENRRRSCPSTEFQCSIMPEELRYEICLTPYQPSAT